MYKIFPVKICFYYRPWHFLGHLKLFSSIFNQNWSISTAQTGVTIKMLCIFMFWHLPSWFLYENCGKNKARWSQPKLTICCPKQIHGMGHFREKGCEWQWVKKIKTGKTNTEITRTESIDQHPKYRSCLWHYIFHFEI